jgi:hypothetical protein
MSETHSLLLTSFSLWLVAVYALRAACFGNPLSRYLAGATEELICQADELATHGSEQATPETLHFVQGFSRRFILGMAVLVLELALLIRLFWIDVLPWLAMGLLVKDLLFAAIGSLAAGHLRTDDKLLSTLRTLPPWLLHLDRAGALLSGAGALAFFLVLASR